MDETQAKARRRSLELFRLDSNDEPVKFLNASGLEHARRSGNLVSGYFTLARWFYGADPTEIEERLGLRSGEFGGVAYALTLERLPAFDEFSYELTAAYPGGRYRGRDVDMAAMQAERESGEATYARSTTPVGSHYPRGDGVVQQWRLLQPLPVSAAVRTVTPALRFARRDGSTGSSEPVLGRLRGVDWS
jgi:hypothetical protein